MNKLSDKELHKIIERTKKFFVEEIVPSHISNTKKLSNLNNFNLNPFLDKYKAVFLTGNDEPESIAKALVYARVLGTSINTTFGNKFQKFCSEVLEGFASTTSGIDIEFIDKLDGRRKYCQVKAGPNTINKDDVETIKGHFQGVINLARTNNLQIGFNDMVVGVFYGTPGDLSSHYRTINKIYPVYVGQDLWYRLTGVIDFYERITNAIGDIATQYDGSELIEDVIQSLTLKIKEELEIKNKESLIEDKPISYVAENKERY